MLFVSHRVDGYSSIVSFILWARIRTTESSRNFLSFLHSRRALMLNPKENDVEHYIWALCPLCVRCILFTFWPTDHFIDDGWTHAPARSLRISNSKHAFNYKMYEIFWIFKISRHRPPSSNVHRPSSIVLVHIPYIGSICLFSIRKHTR